MEWGQWSSCSWYILKLGASPHEAAVSLAPFYSSPVWPHSPILRTAGNYASTLELPLESSFEYKFIVNGEWHHKDDMVREVTCNIRLQWCPSLSHPLQPKVNDPFGGHNNVLNTPPTSPPPAWPVAMTTGVCECVCVCVLVFSVDLSAMHYSLCFYCFQTWQNYDRVFTE